MDVSTKIGVFVYAVTVFFPFTYNLVEWRHHNDRNRDHPFRETVRGAREPRYARQAVYSLVWPVWVVVLLLRWAGKGIGLFIYEAITGKRWGEKHERN